MWNERERERRRLFFNGRSDKRGDRAEKTRGRERKELHAKGKWCRIGINWGERERERLSEKGRGRQPETLVTASSIQPPSLFRCLRPHATHSRSHLILLPLLKLLFIITRFVAVHRIILPHTLQRWTGISLHKAAIAIAIGLRIRGGYLICRRRFWKLISHRQTACMEHKTENVMFHCKIIKKKKEKEIKHPENQLTMHHLKHQHEWVRVINSSCSNLVKTCRWKQKKLQMGQSQIAWNKMYSSLYFQSGEYMFQLRLCMNPKSSYAPATSSQYSELIPPSNAENYLLWNLNA